MSARKTGLRKRRGRSQSFHEEACQNPGFAPGRGFVASPQTHTFPALDTSNTFTGANSFSQQITSTLATRTAPFSIASTTQVTNLNAQLHGGQAAPAGTIVGTTDTQTLVSASASTTSNQNLQSYTYSSGVLNTLGKTFKVTSEGSISFVNTTETVVIGTNIGGVPQETFSFVPPTTGGGNWILNMDCTVGATGVSGNAQCNATLDLAIGATSNLVSTRMANQSNPLAINFTGTVVIQHFVSFTTASTSNVVNQLRMVSTLRN